MSRTPLINPLPSQPPPPPGTTLINFTGCSELRATAITQNKLARAQKPTGHTSLFNLNANLEKWKSEEANVTGGPGYMLVTTREFQQDLEAAGLLSSHRGFAYRGIRKPFPFILQLERSLITACSALVQVLDTAPGGQTASSSNSADTQISVLVLHPSPGSSSSWHRVSTC